MTCHVIIHCAYCSNPYQISECIIPRVCSNYQTASGEPHPHRCIVVSLSALHFTERCQGSFCGPSCCTWRRCTKFTPQSHFTSDDSSMAAQQWTYSPHSLIFKEALPDCSVFTTVSAMSSRPSRVAQGYQRYLPYNSWMCVMAWHREP